VQNSRRRRAGSIGGAVIAGVSPISVGSGDGGLAEKRPYFLIVSIKSFRLLHGCWE
jgi:hypothetical protein